MICISLGISMGQFVRLVWVFLEVDIKIKS